ncbi:serine/threonine-protein kinase NIM1 isoform X1 [Crotalus tigris]|uniref:serine/threonine-protein kinase NIM1 isoform X1 n=1 Tax=Crotalus tigris TaxID=88082 RepID=UPI00192F79F9|nr:serine/threonine-protein kinase NIM1 isoform X1 [Crotalus tigris]
MTEALKPEDKKCEAALRRSHQASAWAIKASTSMAFFTRASVLWLCELQDMIPPDQIRVHQNLGKLVATSQYMADVSLHAPRYSLRAIAADISAHRLLWLKNWRTDLKAKWRLGTKPYAGGHLFGGALNPYLVESKDKRKTLINTTKKWDKRSGWVGHHRTIITGSPFGQPQTGTGPRPLVLSTRDWSASRTVPHPDPGHNSSPSGPFEAQEDALSNEGSDSRGTPPIGGRLSLYSDVWAATTTDSWVLNTIAQGLMLEFWSSPLDRFRTCPTPTNKNRAALMSEAISHLSQIWAIEPVPEDQKRWGFYSTLFVVPKSSGDWTAILDLKGLNYYLMYRTFKMQSLQSIGQHQKKGLPDINRPDRGIFTYPYSPWALQISQVLLCPPALSVQGPPIWPLFSTQSIYKYTGSAGCPPETDSDQNSVLSGRHTDIVLHPEGSIISCPCCQDLSGAWVFCQFSEKPYSALLGAVIDTTNCTVYLSQD